MNLANHESIVSLSQYEEMLQKHDWYYMMSEDSSKYRAGEESYKKLVEISKVNLVFLELFSVYQSKHKI